MVPPKDTVPPPVKPTPGDTVTEELTNRELPIAPALMENDAGLVPEQVMVVQRSEMIPLFVKALLDKDNPVPKRLLNELPLMTRLVVEAVTKDE